MPPSRRRKEKRKANHRPPLATRPAAAPVSAAHRPRSADAAGALCGVAAGTVALVVGQIGGKLVDGAVPPLQALGDFVVRTTPVSITEALIRAVGHKDKQVLLLCMLLVAVAAASLIGLLFGRGRQRLALSGVGLLALLPGLAAVGETAATFAGEAVTLVPAAVLGGLVLQVLGTPLRPALTAPVSPPAKGPGSAGSPDRGKANVSTSVLVPSNPSSGVSRRQMLRAGLVLTAATALGTAAVRRLSKPSVQLTSRLKAALPTPRSPKPLPVDEFARFGAVPLLTPTSSFYRIDTALSPPLVDPDTWSLTLTRDGARITSWSYDQLLAMSLDQADITIGCVSNEIGGDLVGTARWQGVLLADLLNSAGVRSTGRVAGVSVDGFVASFPGSYAFDGRPAMVAVGMNGDVLPVLHGFPARLVVPGLYGYTSATKWLTQIDVSDSTDLPGFWADRGWAPQGPVHIMSRIDSPHNGSQEATGTVRAAGVAWAPIVGVGSVEVRVDEGPWQSATLSAAIEGALWRQWIADVSIPRGTARLTVRATDAKGVRQDTTVRPVFPSGSTGLHTVKVTRG
jgi:DMSO/TMAO reductase YedYZ molybdopterin-dependent catalytic subunit